MKFLKRTMSTVLSVCMISNFTFCSASNPPVNTGERKKSSVFPYVAAAAAAVGAGAAAAVIWNVLKEHRNLGKPLHIPDVPNNIKAIHWNNNRCWWIASVLFLYYWSDFKNFIYTNSDDDFVSIQNENCKSVLKDLREVFRILDSCDGNICYITNDEQRIKRYFSNLEKLEPIAVVDNGENYALLPDLLGLIFDNESVLKRFNVNAAESAVYNDKFTGKRYNVKFMLSNIDGGHFYVYLQPIDGGKGFAIGRSTLPDEETISICDLAWNNHAHWPLIKVFKGFK